jgi:AbrB family looped-hinge helix DNA binding protein
MGDLSVTSKGQVTIPKAVRQKLGIRAGSKVQFHVVGDHAEMVPVSAPVEVPSDGYGLLKSRRGSAPADFDVASLLRRR